MHSDCQCVRAGNAHVFKLLSGVFAVYKRIRWLSVYRRASYLLCAPTENFQLKKRCDSDEEEEEEKKKQNHYHQRIEQTLRGMNQSIIHECHVPMETEKRLSFSTH